jgi:hypothetical protein
MQIILTQSREEAKRIADRYSFATYHYTRDEGWLVEVHSE